MIYSVSLLCVSNELSFTNNNAELSVLWFHQFLDKHEPFHIMKVGIRASVEKGILPSQEHGEGRAERQNKWNQIPVQFHEVLSTDYLLLFTCSLNFFLIADSIPPEEKKKGFTWAEVMGESSSKEVWFGAGFR